MTNTPTYFDYNATTPLKDAARARMLEAMELAGNPSSVHSFGRQARKAMEDARESMAQSVGVRPAQIIFTSGGTEAIDLALNGLRLNGAPYPCLVSSIEHDATLAARSDVATIPVDANGIVNLDKLESDLALLGKPALVSIMLANNETGVIQPVQAAAEIVHKYGGLLHVDAVQAYGKIPVNFILLNADLMTLSAHKIGGPKGVGALVLRDGISIEPRLKGGGQEQRRRAGTENLVGIAGFGGAASVLRDDMAHMQKLAGWRDTLEATILANAPEAVIYGKEVPRLPNTSLVGWPQMAAETQLMAMDLAGFAVSTGAACSSGKVKPSHVLLAMGMDAKAAQQAIRISSGWATREEDYLNFAQAWLKMARRAAV